MKNVSIILGVLFMSLGVHAQHRSDLQGPAYKNYKPWQHDTPSTVLYVAHTKKQSLKGPEFKNYKPWRDNTASKKIVITTNGSERQKLTGPAYKNYKPWRSKAK